MRRRLTLRVASPALLEEVAAAPRSMGMPVGKTSFQVLRETYYDSRDRALAGRRLTLRLVLMAHGEQHLELLEATSVSLQGVVDEEVLTTPVLGGGLYATLAGASELATRVRDVVDPVALRPVLALDIDRETIDLKSGWLGRMVRRATFDQVQVHFGGGARALHQITVAEVWTGGPPLEVLGERLRERFGIVHDGLDTVEWARREFAGPAAAAGVEPTRSAGVSLLLLRDGMLGLTPGDRGMTLPSQGGAGEDAAATATHEILGCKLAPEELELVGYSPSRGAGVDQEVWLYPCPPDNGGGDALTWVPLVEVLTRAGSPGLSDPDLVGALLLFIRSEIGLRLLREMPTPAGPPVSIPQVPRPAEPAPGEHPEDLLETELSILDFNQRVLELAEDPRIPLLERFRFLSIFSSNMDEFFVVRVGRLKTRPPREGEASGPELTTAALLDLIQIRVRALVARQYACLRGLLLPALAGHGVQLRTWRELTPQAQAALSARFESEILPLLTPRALTASPGHPFPRLESLGLSLAALLRESEASRPQIAHVPLPAGLPRLLPIPGTRDLIPLEQVVEAQATALFPAFSLAEVHAFRVSRLGDVVIDEGRADSLLASIEDEVEARPYKPVVRLEVQASMPREVRAHLLRELRSEAGAESQVLNRWDIFEVDGPLDLNAFSQLADLDVPGEKYPSFSAAHPLPPGRPIFEVLDEGDLLVHHPYESFDTTVGRFLMEAANDPHVVSIKLTLYRTGKDSPLADALLQALRNGKDVAAFVELKARFDEESNIHWTRRLIDAGGHVVYGLVGFKTHAKTALVVRREKGEVRRYVHVGTGNYNASTARFYTDVGLMSADPELGADLTDFFNELMGSPTPPVKEYRRLWVAPASMAPNLTRRIEREIEHARAGRPARIQAKLNGITDKRIVKALYAASQEGVQIDLLVRAICTLRPGVPGLSENIRVHSILGRFLEHARVYYFLNGGEEEYFIGSADWRKRNLRKRVEVATPVQGSEGRARLRAILDRELADPRLWSLRPDGAYERRSGPGPSAQESFVPKG